MASRAADDFEAFDDPFEEDRLCSADSPFGEGAQGLGAVRRRRVIAFVGVGLLLLGSLVAYERISQQHSPSIEPLIQIDDIDSLGWRVIDASANYPLSYTSSAGLVETFFTANKSKSVTLLIQRMDPTFADDSNLGSWTPNPITPGEATRANTRVFDTGGKALNAYWVEPELAVSVSLQTTSLTPDEADRFVSYLFASPDIRASGYNTRDRSYTHSVRPSPSHASTGPVAFVTLESTDTPGMIVNIVAGRTEPQTPQQAPIQFGEQPPTTTQTLRSGHLFTSFSGFRPWLNGTWTDGDATFTVTAGRRAADYSEPNRQGQRAYPNFDYPDFAASDTFTTANRTAIVDLLANVRAGSPSQWKTLIAALQDEPFRLPIQRTLRVGENELLIRSDPTKKLSPGYMCSRIVCAPIYFQNITQSSDLIIDGHWWHFEKVGSVEKKPTWRISTGKPRLSAPGLSDEQQNADTRPPLAELTTVEDRSNRWNIWYGVDFGTRTVLVRRGDENNLLARPLAR